MKILKKSLISLIESAKQLGLNDFDIKNAKEYLDFNEFGLCFDTIITQIYKYDIQINNEFYDLIINIGNMMHIESESYSFMKELIKG